MNPWQSLRREIDGVMRSIRYDVSVRRARRVMRRDTVLLPIIRRRPAPDRRRFYAVTAAVLLPVAGMSGYLAVTSGLDALFPAEGSPNGLPASTPGDSAPSPAPAAAPTPAESRPVGGTQGRWRTVPRTSPVGPSFTAPVPTPAPTCQCTVPSPLPTPTPNPTMSPSSTPSMTPPPTPAPTRSGPPSRSPSPLPTSRLMP